MIADSTTFGVTILANRSMRRQKQSDVARYAGIHIQTLVDIERDRISITEETYKRILQAMDTIQEAQANISS